MFHKLHGYIYFLILFKALSHLILTAFLEKQTIILYALNLTMEEIDLDL